MKKMLYLLLVIVVIAALLVTPLFGDNQVEAKGKTPKGGRGMCQHPWCNVPPIRIQPNPFLCCTERTCSNRQVPTPTPPSCPPGTICR